MKPELREALFASIKNAHDNALKLLKEHYVGSHVILKAKGLPEGRSAIITGVMILDGEPRFLCMVLRNGATRADDFLNGAGWTRSYRRWEDFVVVRTKQ